jgi:CHRD domain
VPPGGAATAAAGQESYSPLAPVGKLPTVGTAVHIPIAAGAKLNDDQMKAFKAGELYVNVHSDANKGGEIRGQLKP